MTTPSHVTWTLKCSQLTSPPARGQLMIYRILCVSHTANGVYHWTLNKSTRVGAAHLKQTSFVTRVHCVEGQVKKQLSVIILSPVSRPSAIFVFPEEHESQFINIRIDLLRYQKECNIFKCWWRKMQCINLTMCKEKSALQYYGV